MSIPDMDTLPEIIMLDSSAYNPDYSDHQPDSSQPMTGFGHNTSSYGHVIESAWKLRDGQLVFERAARLQEVNSSADESDLEALDSFEDHPLPPDTTPPPAPQRRLKLLTPSIGPSAPSSPKPRDYDPDRSTAANSPSLSQGWSPWPPSRRRTETNISGASSLLRAPASTRAPLDQATVVTRLGDVLEQPSRRTFSPFRRLHHQSYPATPGKPSRPNSAAAASKRGVSFLSPTTSPVLSNAKPTNILPMIFTPSLTSSPPPIRTLLNRTDPHHIRHSPPSQHRHVHRGPSPPRATANEPSPTSSQRSPKHHQHVAQTPPQSSPSRVKIHQQPKLSSRHSSSSPSPQLTPTLLPPGLSRSRSRPRQREVRHDRRDLYPQPPLDPLSEFTDGERPDWSTPYANAAAEGWFASSRAYVTPKSTQVVPRWEDGNREQQFRTRTNTVSPSDLKNTGTEQPGNLHWLPPVSAPGYPSGPSGTSRTANTWPSTFSPGHKRPRSSADSERQPAVNFRRPHTSYSYSDHYTSYSGVYDERPRAMVEPLPSDTPTLFHKGPLDDGGYRVEDPIETLGVPQFQSTPPRVLRRTDKPKHPSRNRPPTPPEDVFEMLETNIRNLGFALGDIEGLSSYFGKVDVVAHDVYPHTITSKRITTALYALTSGLKRHRSLTTGQLRLASGRWHTKRLDRLGSLWRTIHGFSRFVHTISRRELTSSLLTKASVKLVEFESKLSNLASKFNSLLTRLRVRQLYSMLSTAHTEASEQLKSARSKRDLPGWEAAKKYRAELRREYIDSRNRFAQARRTSLKS